MKKEIIKKKIVNGFPIGQYGHFCVITEDGSIYYGTTGNGGGWKKLDDIEEVREVPE